MQSAENGLTPYDERGRVKVSQFAEFDETAARTVSYDYSVNGNDPLTTSVSDPVGTVTSTIEKSFESVM